MADIFDTIPTLAVVLLAVGFAGVMVYERARSRLPNARTDGAE